MKRDRTKVNSRQSLTVTHSVRREVDLPRMLKFRKFVFRNVEMNLKMKKSTLRVKKSQR